MACMVANGTTGGAPWTCSTGPCLSFVEKAFWACLADLSEASAPDAEHLALGIDDHHSVWTAGSGDVHYLAGVTVAGAVAFLPTCSLASQGSKWVVVVVVRTGRCA